MKKALVIGIDSYSSNPLSGCVNDAVEISQLLRSNGDGSPNFDVMLLTSNTIPVTTAVLSDKLRQLFAVDADVALLYFSGHGHIDPATSAGYLISQDGAKGAWGINFSDIITMANQAYPRIKSTILIVDSCHSGALGDSIGFGNSNVAAIGSGVTILTASRRDEPALMINGKSVFTSMLIDALSGSAADVCGRITPASVYSHIDQTFGGWVGQRPIYKANVQSFVALRLVAPKVAPDVLRKLPTYFPNPTDHFRLDPSYEPDRKNIPEQFRHLPVDPIKTGIFKELQMCNRCSLVVPVDADHMYDAAINSTACKLTALGAHYRHLASLGRL